MSANQSRYDQNEYYASNLRGSRLAPCLDFILNALESTKCYTLKHTAGLKSGKVLDVGAGSGFFLSKLKKNGYEVFGTTASSVSAASAERLLGLRLAVSETLDESRSLGPFDAITYWHVYEHLKDPQSHSNMWTELLKPDGILLIEVPNIDSIGAKICFKSWLGSDIEHHVNHQEPAQIRQTLTELGFVIEHTEYFSMKFSYVLLWSSLLGAAFGKPYYFDRLMFFLKKPLSAIRSNPLVGLNTFASLFYLMPLICVLIAFGILTKRGEIIRLIARRSKS